MLTQLKNYQAEHASIAYAYAILSNIFASIMFSLQKKSLQFLDPIFVVSFRALCLIIINSFAMQAQNIAASQFPPKIHNLIIKRSIVHGTTFILMSIGLEKLSVSVTTSLFNLSPIFVHFLQVFMFGKSISKIHFSFTLICFMGVLLIVKPDFLFSQGDGLSYYIVFPLAAAFNFAIASIYLHQMKGKISNLVPLHYFYLGQSLISGPLQLCRGLNFHLQDVTYIAISIYLIGLIACSYSCQYLMTRAIMTKAPSLVMPFNYLTVIISLAIDTWIFEIHFDVYSLIGIMLTSSGLLIKLIIKQ